jgi:hypothetical protein
MEKLRGAINDAQDRISRRGAELLDKAVKDPRFRDKILEHDFDGKTHFRAKGGKSTTKSNAEVYEIISKGRERDTEDDDMIDLQVVLSPLNKGTVGSTVLGNKWFKTAYWFIDRCAAKNDPISVARHFMHEWLHVAGFYHYGGNSARGDVPYAVGTIVRDLLKDRGNGFLQGDEAEDSAIDYMLEEADHLVEINAASELDVADERDLVEA